MTEWMTPTKPRRLDRRKSLTERMIREAFEMATPKPRLVGSDSAVGGFAVTGAIEPQRFAWDTNCFYRRLGLSADCERIEIARAFNDLAPDHPRFAWFAIAARVLLKKRLRRVYNNVPLGDFWTDDPALIDYRIRGMESGTLMMERPEWGVYADYSVTDYQALSLDPAWRNALAIAVGRLQIPYLSHIGIGATDRRSRERWEMVGYLPVFFVALDREIDESYVALTADLLQRSISIVSV